VAFIQRLSTGWGTVIRTEYYNLIIGFGTETSMHSVTVKLAQEIIFIFVSV